MSDNRERERERITPIHTRDDIEEATTEPFDDDAYTGPETLPEDPIINGEDQR